VIIIVMIALIASAFRFVRHAINPNVQVDPAPSDIQIDWDVPVRMRDGVILRVNIFRPRTTARVPVIMSAHPYGKDEIPANSRSGRKLSLQSRLLRQPHKITISALTGWEAPDPAFWTGHGYAVINADLRGAGTSDGTGTLFSDAEALDYYDLIEWAGAQDWCSGRVGLDGVSYLAISQYKVAALHPPSLAAICPWEGLSDIYRDFARPGGVREDGFSKLWSRLTARAARLTTNMRDEIVARPLRDEWYRSLTPDLAEIKVPMLVCASFSDHSLHTRGSFEAFARAGSTRKRLYTHRDGKWCAYYSPEAAAARLRFFDRTLKKVENGWDEDPLVRLAITESGSTPVAVMNETAWPPADLTWRKLALDARSARLLPDDTELVPATSMFKTREGTLSFVWTIPEDMDVIGPMALQVHIELAGTDDVSIFAGVRKLREGREVTFEGSYGFGGDMVSKGWQRAAHRTLDAALSTPSRPVHVHDREDRLTDGEIVLVQVALQPHATRFLRGEQLRLDIRGRWHYPTGRLRGQFPAAYQASPPGSCIVHTGGRTDSHLLVGTRPVDGRVETFA
jgi:predicted acyl esterase